jgi:hypothetical protein
MIIKIITSFHSLFSKINYNLAETLINIGTFKIYQKGDEIKNIFLNDDGKGKLLNNTVKNHKNTSLGFIIYGKVKLASNHPKSDSYSMAIEDGESIGEHVLESIVDKGYESYRNIKVEVID